MIKHGRHNKIKNSSDSNWININSRTVSCRTVNRKINGETNMTKQGISSITVAALIEMLQEQDQNLPVVFAYDYGDHWHTKVAGTISQADVQNVRYSDYHRMNKICDGEEGEEAGIEAVVLE